MRDYTYSPFEEEVQTASDEVFVPKLVKERELFPLALDYRNPFLGTVAVPKKVVVSEKPIQYTGFIQQKSASSVSFLALWKANNK